MALQLNRNVDPIPHVPDVFSLFAPLDWRRLYEQKSCQALLNRQHAV